MPYLQSFRVFRYRGTDESCHLRLVVRQLEAFVAKNESLLAALQQGLLVLPSRHRLGLLALLGLVFLRLLGLVLALVLALLRSVVLGFHLVLLVMVVVL